jgi:hypothetical protein
MSTPTGASGKFTSVYSDAARILPSSTRTLNPNQHISARLLARPAKKARSRAFFAGLRSNSVALVPVTPVTPVTPISTLHTRRWIRLLRPAGVSAYRRTRRATNSATDDGTLLTTPIITNCSSGATADRTTYRAPHLRVICTRRQQQHRNQTDFFHH